MTNYDLKPCPFCGGEAELDKGGDAVNCPNCFASCYGNMTDDTIIAWNHRVSPLQKWEPGSNPPDGWYFFIIKSGGRSVYPIYSGMAIMPEQNLSRSWEWWAEIGYQIYGPIPEPEVEE
jgi:hypothetical protein